MPRDNAKRMCAAVGAAALCAIALLSAQCRPDSGRAQPALEFHSLVGGLGFGPALDLSRCTNSFDPRLGAICSQEFGHVPAGREFCPHHASSIFCYPGLETDGRDMVPGETDARRP
jgi:hypothetical protein